MLPERDITQPHSFDEAGAKLAHLAAKGDAIQTVDALIACGERFGASDVYLEPWTDGVAVRLRIDGVLHDFALLPAASHPRMVARIKVLARLPVYEKSQPQDGRIEAADSPAPHALRVSTFPTVHGESVVLRALGREETLRSLDGLGFSEPVTAGLRELVSRPQGVLLLTGPTSSGKTTTIYSLLREILERGDRARHIVTIEDPVEYRLGRVSQTQLGTHGPMTFVSALRSLLRQDPDVIVVGEIRDSDTARAAIQAGLTGHLVISTIHSGSAAGVFSRLLDMGAEQSTIASSVTGVLAQRLVRVNCTACREAYAPDAALVARYGGDPDGAYQRGAGCRDCNGIGYRGRTAIGELLLLDRAFADCIQHGVTTGRFQDAAVERGMVTILEDALARVATGETTLEELRHVLPPEPAA